ncbi:hypothetical protein [Micromonospora sp. RP3T]
MRAGAAALLLLAAWIFDRALWVARRRGVLSRDGPHSASHRP